MATEWEKKEFGSMPSLQGPLQLMLLAVDIDNLLQLARQKSPEHENVFTPYVGAYARFLVSDGARLMTGSTIYVGYNIMAG